MNRLADLTAFGIAAMKIVSRTLEAWPQEILQGWRLPRTDGITERSHRQMTLIESVVRIRIPDACLIQALIRSECRVEKWSGRRDQPTRQRPPSSREIDCGVREANRTLWPLKIQ